MIPNFDRRRFLVGSSAVVLTGLSGSLLLESPNGEKKTTSKRAAIKQEQIAWHDPSKWGVEGRAFDDTKKYYDRLPAEAESIVRKQVWDLSRFSSGISFQFKTDSPEIHIKYRLSHARLSMPHMPATSVSGVDLYAKDDDGHWRWVSVLKPGKQEIESKLASNLAKPKSGLRELMIYLPLFNGVEKLQVGVTSNSKFESIAPREKKPVLFYGTSIMHGACASRSGMSISAIVGRKLDRPTINLGFSGNGRMEKEVGQFLVETDPAVFAIDCLPNMGPKQVTERCGPLVNQIREARPDTPILLVEDRVNTGAWIRNGAEERHAANQAALREAYEKLLASGVKHLHYLEGTSLLGDDGEAATDGSHPSDLGMVRYAAHYETALNKILPETE